MEKTRAFDIAGGGSSVVASGGDAALPSQKQLMESLQAMQRMLFREQARVKEFELRERARARRAARRAADVAVLVANSAAFGAAVLASRVARLFPSYRPGGGGGGGAASHVDAGRVPFAVALALILCGYARPVAGDLDAAASSESVADVSARRIKDESRRQALLGVASTPRSRRAARRTELLRAAVDLRRMSECSLLLRDERRSGCRSPASESRIEVAGIPIALHAILASMRVHGRGGGALARRQPQPGMQRTSVTEPTANTSNDVVIQRVLRAVAAEQTPAWEALIGDSALVEIERVRAAWRRDPGCAPACAAPGLSSAPVAAGAPPPPSAPSLGAAQVSFFMYRYISRESCSQFDSIPLTSLTTADHAHCAWHCAGRSDHVDAATDVAAAAELGRCGDRGALPRVSPRCLATAPPRTRFTGPCSHPARTTAVLSRSLALSLILPTGPRQRCFLSVPDTRSPRR